MQSRSESFVEAVVNAAVGIVVSVGVTKAWFGVSLVESAAVTGVYLVLSSARSYGLRRLFEWAPWRQRNPRFRR